MMSWVTSLLSLLAGRRRPVYRLAEALAAVPEAVALFDRNDRLLFCNAAFRRTYHIPTDARARGRGFAAILYTSRLFEIAEEPLRDPRDDEMCNRILAHHRAANGQTLLLPAYNGRRVEFRALRTQDGCTLTTRLEIAGPRLQTDGRVVDFQSVYRARKM